MKREQAMSGDLNASVCLMRAAFEVEQSLSPSSLTYFLSRQDFGRNILRPVLSKALITNNLTLPATVVIAKIRAATP